MYGKHTPWPWYIKVLEVEMGGTRNVGVARWLVDSNNNTIETSSRLADTKGNAEAEANIRLMRASIPLRNSTEDLLGFIQTGKLPDGDSTPYDMINRAYSALRMAEKGEQ